MSSGVQAAPVERCGDKWFTVKIFQNECIRYLRSQKHHIPVCVCMCHHSGTYFHGYGDPVWPMKVCLLQTSLCALIIALCVSYPAVRGGRRTRKSETTMLELVGEIKIHVWR